MTDKEIARMQQLAIGLAKNKDESGELANMVLMMFHVHPTQQPGANPGAGTAKPGAAAKVIAKDAKGNLIGTR